MTANKFMPMYWGDYLRDTGHLSAAEHGAYLLMIGHYWTTGAPLPADDEALRRLSRMERAEWKRSRGAVLAMFQRDGDTYRHKRIDAELAAAAERYERRSQAGRKGNEKRWSGDPSATQETSQCDPNAIPMRSQPQPQPHSPNGEKRDADASRGAPAPLRPADAKPDPRGTRLPEGWELPDDWREWAVRQGIPPPAVDREADRFADYWRGRAGKDGRKADWAATWRNWVRRATEGNGHGRFGDSREQRYVARDDIRRAGILDALADELDADGPGAGVGGRA